MAQLVQLDLLGQQELLEHRLALLVVSPTLMMLIPAVAQMIHKDI
jgi:hypothetical protein